MDDKLHILLEDPQATESVASKQDAAPSPLQTVLKEPHNGVMFGLKHVATPSGSWITMRGSSDFSGQISGAVSLETSESLVESTRVLVSALKLS